MPRPHSDGRGDVACLHVRGGQREQDARTIRIVARRDPLEHGNRLLTVAARQHHAREIELRRGIVRRLFGRLAIRGLGLVEAAVLLGELSQADPGRRVLRIDLERRPKFAGRPRGVAL